MRWRVADRAYETFFARSIINARSTLHLTYRLCSRISFLVEPAGRATAGAGLWHVVLPAFIALDIGIWLVLRKRPGLGLGWRLILDSGDIAFWSLSPLPPSGLYDGAVLLGIPLAVESGFRLSLRGLIVPITTLTVTAAVRVAADLPVLPFTFAWLVLGVGIGLAFHVYCRRVHEEADAERATRDEADARRAYLSGQNSVAMGASSVVDAIEAVVPVLGRPRPGSALWQLAAGWKADLGASTMSEVTYLQVALLEWERRHNDHPDLASRVRLEPAEGTGTALLTRTQVGWLGASLDALDLRGWLRVTLAGGTSGSGLPGRAVRLRVGPHEVDVAEDAGARQRPVDPVPMAFVLIAAQCLTMLPSPLGYVPPTWVAAAIAICLAAAYWTHRALLVRGPAARPAILVMTVAVAFVLTAINVLGLRVQENPDGFVIYGLIGLMLLSYGAGFYWYGLPRRLIALVAASAALSVLFSMWVAVGLRGNPFVARTVAVNLIFLFAPFPTARQISISLGRAREAHLREAGEQERKVRMLAYREGQEAVVHLVQQARDDAYQQLASIGSALEPALADHVTRRLEEVDRRLTRMELLESSSSTTTS
ncbi:MAG: hypothetical protein ACRD12_10485 [Acidimicrobiales bacterium]